MNSVYKSILAIESPEIGYTLYTTNKDDTMDDSVFRSDVWFEVVPEELEAMKRLGRVYETDKGCFVAA